VKEVKEVRRVRAELRLPSPLLPGERVKERGLISFTSLTHFRASV